MQIEDIKKVIEKFHKQGVQDLEAIMKPFKPTREDIQEMEAMITRKEKELAQNKKSVI